MAGSVLMAPAPKLISARTAGSGTRKKPLATQLAVGMAGLLQRHPVAGVTLGSPMTTR